MGSYRLTQNNYYRIRNTTGLSQHNSRNYVTYLLYNNYSMGKSMDFSYTTIIIAE